MNAYLVLDITIHDLQAFSEYIQKIPKFIEKHFGRYLVRGEEPTVVEGGWEPEKMVIIEFPSRQNAKEFLKDPEVQPLFAIRHETATSKLVMVDGCI